jgi:ABC-2 type transport system permease protein
MFKRELKLNFKSFLIWTLILVGMFLAVFLIYPYIMTSENVDMLNEMMKVFPPEVLKAFNMDISEIDTAFGWLKTEGFIFVLLISGIFSGILGSNIVLKEESDKTIEYLHNLPVTRTKIITSKILCAITYIVSMIAILGIFNYIGLTISGNFNVKQYLLLSISPILTALVIFSICLFISTFTHKTKKTIGISLGIVFASYFLQILAELSKEVEFLKYITPFTLSDTRNIITNTTINPICIIVSLLLTVFLIVLSIYKYNKKELV